MDLPFHILELSSTHNKQANVTHVSFHFHPHTHTHTQVHTCRYTSCTANPTLTHHLRSAPKTIRDQPITSRTLTANRRAPLTVQPWQTLSQAAASSRRIKTDGLVVDLKFDFVKVLSIISSSSWLEPSRPLASRLEERRQGSSLRPRQPARVHRQPVV